MKTDFIYGKVNDLVIKGLKEKGLEWFKPWKINGVVADNVNYTNRKKYRGINTFILNSEMMDKGYPTPEWVTYKKAKASGGSVKTGEHGTMVVYWMPYWVDKESGKFSKVAKEGYDMRFMLKYYTVFNIAQCEGLESKFELEEVEEKEPLKPIERAEAIIGGYKKAPKIVHEDKFRAFYSPRLDFINMPEMDSFVDADSYYKTLFHEAAHSTGHKDRLNRATLEKISKFGDKEYSREELVAEICSQYLVGVADLDPKDGMENTKAYINGWIAHLTNHEREALTAMGQASKAADYILGIS